MSKQHSNEEVRQAGDKRPLETAEPAPDSIQSVFDLVDIILTTGLEQLSQYAQEHNIHYNDPKFIEASSALLVGQNSVRKARKMYE